MEESFNGRAAGRKPWTGRLLSVRLAACAAILLLSACSAVQLGYNSSDLLLRWRGEQYFDFQGEQADAYAARVGNLMRWHRVNALPEYARFADEAARRIARGLSREDLVWGYDSIRGQVNAALRTAAGEVAGLLDQLTPAQLENFERRLAKDNRNFAKEQLSGTLEERRAQRVKRSIERLEDWVGELTSGQLERVQQYGVRAPLTAEYRDRERRRLQRELVDMLKAREARARLADFVVQWDSHRAPDYDRASRAQLEEYLSMLLDLERTLTPAQREKAVLRMRALATDFAELAREVR
jgi:hypothetical protein